MKKCSVVKRLSQLDLDLPWMLVNIFSFFSPFTSYLNFSLLKLQFLVKLQLKRSSTIIFYCNIILFNLYFIFSSISELLYCCRTLSPQVKVIAKAWKPVRPLTPRPDLMKRQEQAKLTLSLL